LAEIVQRLDEGDAGRIGLSMQKARKAGQATEKEKKGTKAVDHGFHGEEGLF
jgi:predicted RNA-binding protein with RPS1 domain